MPFSLPSHISMMALLSVYVIGSHLSGRMCVGMGVRVWRIEVRMGFCPPVLDAVILVRKLLGLEDRTQEKVLELLVGEIDAELLEAVHLEYLEAKDIEQPDEARPGAVHAWLGLVR